MKYVIMKNSRDIGKPIPYAGPTCEQAGIRPGQIYTNKHMADLHARLLSHYNKVGFQVVTLEK